MWITLTKPWKSKLVPTAGIEPATCWLQVSCTTNCAKSAFGCRRKSRTFVPRLSVAYSNRWARRQFGEVRRIRTCDITHTAFALPTEIGPQRNKIMVGIVGFEPTTFRLEGERSIQLSYIPKYWLGRLDSNQSMQESKSCALPAWLHPNIWWSQLELNQRYKNFQSFALPTELWDHEMVERIGLEPMTPCVQGRCSPSWANAPLYQVSKKYGGARRIRTCDLTVNSRVLYLLS